MTADSAIQTAAKTFRDWWGEPAEIFQFDASQAKPGRQPQLARLQILYWPAADSSSLSQFATVGMSSRSMLGALHRTELIYRQRGPILPEDLPRYVKFLANLAVHPFVHATSFDWGHSLKLQHGPPGFPGCEAVLFHSALPGDKTDTLPTADGPVRLLNLIPLNAEEIALQRAKGTPALVSHFDRQRIDVFTTR